MDVADVLSEQQQPDLEDLAAFVEGRLTGEKRARVEERLARDEDYYDVFLETVRFREENGLVTSPAPVRWRTRRIVVPLAAAALLAVAFGILRPDGASPGEWVAQLDSEAIVAQEGWTDPGWSELRAGNAVEDVYRPEELAFRLGVRAFDLRVALAAGDREAAARALDVLVERADAAELRTVSLAYQNLQQQMGATSSDVAPRHAAEIEQMAQEIFGNDSLEARWFAAGLWAEAGRLAAFSRATNSLAQVLQSAPDEELASEIDALEPIFRNAQPSDKEFDDALASFEKIVARLGGG